jgi:hypothetical protein
LPVFEVKTMGLRLSREVKAAVSVVTAALVIIALLSRPAGAQWQAELADQILEEHECEVAFVSQVKESEKQGQRILAAKVHCLDKRSFDALRKDDFEPFEFDECEPPETKSC